VATSENAKDLISKILVTAPEKRLTLDEIIRHPFIDHSGPVPKLMPLSTLACPPTPSYMKYAFNKGDLGSISFIGNFLQREQVRE